MSVQPKARPVSIVTDSTADLLPELLDKREITVVPLSVEVSGEVFQDGIDLTREEFLHRLQAGEFPRTSQPPVGAFQAIYRDLIDRGHDVLSIHIASQLSGTYNSAHAAAQAVDPGRVHVVDSGSVSMGFGWLVIEAYDRAKQGATLDELSAFAEERKKDGRVIAMLETLEYLRRGGRIGRASAFLGSALQIKPIVEVAAGLVEPRERVRTTRRAIERTVTLAETMMPFDHVTVMHLGAPERAATVAQRISELRGGEPVAYGELGTVIGTYSGPGIVGFAGLVNGSGRET